MTTSSNGNEQVIPSRLAAVLEAAGVEGPETATLSDSDLRKIPGLGPALLTTVRQLWPVTVFPVPSTSKPVALLASETIPIATLSPHPRNDKSHPADQLAHIIASLRSNGVYRNIVISQDNFILAGHGVVEALTEIGTATVEVRRLPFNHNTPQALKVLVGDNHIPHLAERDDRKLTEVLKDIFNYDGMDLLGTGFDESMLTNLVFVTRHETEIGDLHEAAEWVGMPEFESTDPRQKLIISFETNEDRIRFVDETGLRIDKRAGTAWSTRWPFTEREDSTSVILEEAAVAIEAEQ